VTNQHPGMAAADAKKTVCDATAQILTTLGEENYLCRHFTVAARCVSRVSLLYLAFVVTCYMRHVLTLP
jgi:hypothetical protein